MMKFSKSRTQQNFRDQCDINEILRRSQKNGMLPDTGKTPLYTDVSSIPDFHQAQNVVARANEAFAAMPAKVRERFNNDPGRMVNFLQDPNNVHEAISLGLMEAVEQKTAIQEPKAKPQAQKKGSTKPKVEENKPNPNDPELPLDE